MLTADVRFEGWKTEDWSRFLDLWKPRAVKVEAEPTRPRGGVIAIVEKDTVVKLIHTAKGRIAPPPPPAPDGPPFSLAELAGSQHASWGIAAERGALDEVMERFGARARRGDDITQQALLLVTIVREMIREGGIESWPRRLHGVPVPTAPMIDRTIGSICADGHTIALGMFKDEELWTAFVARRRGRGFDVLAGPDELRPAMGVLSGEWRRDYRHLVRAVEDHYGPLSLGFFAEVERFRELQIDPRPGAWGRAVALRDVVVTPIPSAVGLALGVDVSRYALEGLRNFTQRIGWFDPVVQSLRKRLGSAATGADVTVSGTLGFDPMAALRALLRR
ncbi:hypothetical protein LVJ94_46740 [Pendulispora rubella]|uniref:Uncharacterized protein n=1 Tax=Pendulispora rubella TaxID=2741070 RepID=A0ABZ2L0C0_9BACT